MKNQLFKNILLLLLLSFELTSCYKRQFYEDPDDPGLSRFTNRTYNVTSAYINSESWVTSFYSLSGPSRAQVFRDSTSSPRDTLQITWEGGFTNRNAFSSSPWRDWPYLTISMPIKKNFSKDDFLNLNGKIFPADSTTVTVSLSNYEFISPAVSLTGTGKIYFVYVKPGSHDREFTIAGLFEGNIGDSIHITKGRFDYRILPSDNNLH